MIRLMMLGTAAIALGGCALRTPYMGTPTVDMAGVHPVTYNKDLGQCQALKIKRNAEVIWTDRIIRDCMADRDYKILEGPPSG
jgi:hypothetical protein